jgi:hypothetical protein
MPRIALAASETLLAKLAMADSSLPGFPAVLLAFAQQYRARRTLQSPFVVSAPC